MGCTHRLVVALLVVAVIASPTTGGTGPAPDAEVAPGTSGRVRWEFPRHADLLTRGVRIFLVHDSAPYRRLEHLRDVTLDADDHEIDLELPPGDYVLWKIANGEPVASRDLEVKSGVRSFLPRRWLSIPVDGKQRGARRIPPIRVSRFDGTPPGPVDFLIAAGSPHIFIAAGFLDEQGRTPGLFRRFPGQVPQDYILVVGGQVVGSVPSTQEPTSAHVVSLQLQRGDPIASLPGLVDPGTGETASLDTRGRVVVLEFWASWCKPCKPALRRLARLAEARKRRDDDRVTYLAVSLDSSLEAMRGASDVPSSRAVGYAWSPRGFSSDLATSLGVMGVPITFVLDREGRLAWTSWDPRGATLAEAIEATLLRAPDTGDPAPPAD